MSADYSPVSYKVMPLKIRVAKGFQDNAAKAYGDKYLDHLLTRIDGIEQTTRRTTFLLIVLAGSFLLVTSAKGAQLTVGPFELSQESATLALVPAVFTYFCYELVVLWYAADRYIRVKNETISTLYPSLWQNDLEAMLAPASTRLWGDQPWSYLRSRPPGWTTRLADASSWAIVAAIVIGAIWFTAHSYRYLLDVPNVSLLVLLSLVFSVLNLSRALLLVRDQRQIARDSVPKRDE